MSPLLLALLPALLAQDAPPPLRVEGKKLLAKDGAEVLLRGVSLGDPLAQGAEIKKETFETLAKEWKANCVRIPVLPGAWKEKGAEAYDKVLDDAVEGCRAAGLYLILDYHAIGNPKTGVAQKEKPEHNSTMELARQFWGHVPPRYKDKPWVLYEIFNEPTSVSWKDLRPLLAELAGLVQAGAPDAVVIASCPDWNFDLRGPAAEPIEAKNVLYAWHVPPSRGLSWEPYIGEARRKLPIIVTEWGFDLNGTDLTRGSTAGFGFPLLTVMEDNRMHWTAASWSPSLAPSMLGAGKEVTPFGKLVRDRLNGEMPRPRPSLKDVKDFFVWSRQVDLKALGETKFDLCILDKAADGKVFSRDDLEFLKWSRGGPKLVLASFYIGENALVASAEWQGPPNPDRIGRYHVKYWDAAWQKLVLEDLDRVLDLGFDGICVEDADTWAFWKKKDERARPRLIELLSQVSQRGKRKNKEFIVLTRDGEDLLEVPAAYAAVDGICRGHVYFTKYGTPVGGAPRRDMEACFDKLVKEGKKALLLEFIGDPKLVDWVYVRAKEKGYPACVTVPDRDALVIHPGHEPQ